MVAGRRGGCRRRLLLHQLRENSRDPREEGFKASRPHPLGESARFLRRRAEGQEGCGDEVRPYEKRPPQCGGHQDLLVERLHRIRKVLFHRDPMPSRLLCRYSWYRIWSCMSFTRETIPSRWQCQYGPTDRSNAVHRVSADMVPLPKKYNQKGKRITSGWGQKGPRTMDAQEGGSIKRGCQCMFYVKRYYFLPDIAEISYITVKHISREGVVVHDKTTVRDKTSYAKPFRRR
jgi:hypothetical protein